MNGCLTTWKLSYCSNVEVVGFMDALIKINIYELFLKRKNYARTLFATRIQALTLIKVSKDLFIAPHGGKYLKTDTRKHEEKFINLVDVMRAGKTYLN